MKSNVCVTQMEKKYQFENMGLENPILNFFNKWDRSHKYISTPSTLYLKIIFIYLFIYIFICIYLIYLYKLYIYTYINSRCSKIMRYISWQTHTHIYKYICVNIHTYIYGPRSCHSFNNNWLIKKINCRDVLPMMPIRPAANYWTYFWTRCY